MSLIKTILAGVFATAAVLGPWGSAVAPAAAETSKAQTSAAQASVAQTSDPTQTSYSFGVLVLKYFPLTADGQNVDIHVTGDVGDSVASLRAKTDSITSNLVTDLAKGTQYHGYANPAAPASYAYHVVDTKEVDTAVPSVANPYYSPPSNPYAVRPDYPRIMTGANICDYVDNRGVGEVWMYAYQGPSQLQIDESKMAGPNGDVSNEWTHDALPVCSKTYTLYTFNYGRGTAEAFHSHAHQYEFELRYVDDQEYSDGGHLFNDLFEGDNYPQTHGVTGRCGSVHNPPNARSEYDWSNTAPQASDCENWNPDSLGATSQIDCTVWGPANPPCGYASDTDNSQLNYIVWWEQNIPGRGNTVTYRGQSLRNWWDVHGEWDVLVSQRLGLTLPPATGPLKYSFEDGGPDGWSASGNVTALANSTAVGGQDGAHALRIDFHSTQSSDQPYVHVNPTSGGPTAGQTLTAYVYVPSTTASTITAKLYVQDSAYAWHTAGATVVSARGSWVELSFTPTGYSGAAKQLGLQLLESPYNTTSTVYLDAVNWA
ncbi:MAG: hypothetical protein HOW97_38545 [Catenulispora sp.]|nr:hypothetical protein [Catenulispora sp.]